jgi:hypothetical protein
MLGLHDLSRRSPAQLALAVVVCLLVDRLELLFYVYDVAPYKHLVLGRVQIKSAAGRHILFGVCNA